MRKELGVNTKQAERKLRELFKRKRTMTQSGRLLGHLLNELNIESDKQRVEEKVIKRTLERLEGNGVIKLHRSGKVLNGYTVIEQTSRTPAKPRSMPKKPLQEQRVAPRSPSPAKKEEMPMKKNDQLTLALIALQERADKEGNLYVPSIAALIEKDLGVSKSQANSLNGTLQELGLRISPKGRNDEGKRPHWVSMDVTEVTEDMLKEKAASPEQSSGTEHKLLEIIRGLEGRVAALTPDAEASAKLVKVVESLEQKVREQEELIRKAVSELDVKTSEVEELERLLREERAARLVSAAPSAETAAVLKRYGL